ncbi:MAG TPA: DUF945 family protein [Beggiatoa sp.]|nr:DUF945 family protein [Beggiatoa sp.]
MVYNKLPINLINQEIFDMKKIRQLAITSLLVSTVSISLPVSADIATTNSGCETGSLSDEMLCLSLQHRFNGGEPQKSETIAIPFKEFNKNPLVLLAELKKHFSPHLKKHEKPLEIDTTLDFVLSPELLRDFGRWPSVSIKTLVDSKGVGKSDVVFPAYRREVPAKSGKALIDWKGLTAQFTFTGQFENLTVASNTAGLLVEKPGEMRLSFGQSTFNGAFDADLEPTEIDLNLPSFAFQDDAGSVKANNLIFKLNIEKTSKGVGLDASVLKVGHFDVSQLEKGFQISLDNLALTTDAESQGDVLNYTVGGQIGKLTLPKEMTGNLKINSVAGQLAFQRIDEEGWLALQNRTRELAGELETEYSVTPLLMLGQFMELAPKFVPKSPQMALTQFVMETSQGQLKADVSFGIHGNKVISLDNPLFVISALWANVDFSIDKRLLNLIVEKMSRQERQESLAGEPMSEAELAKIKAKMMQEFPFNLLVEGEANNDKKLVADLADGMLTLNGQQMPLFQLLLSLMETQ